MWLIVQHMSGKEGPPQLSVFPLTFTYNNEPPWISSASVVITKANCAQKWIKKSLFCQCKWQNIKVLISGPACWSNEPEFCPFRVWGWDRCPHGSAGSGGQHPPGGRGTAGCLEIGHHRSWLERVLALSECTLACKIWDGKDGQAIVGLKLPRVGPWAKRFLMLCFSVPSRPPTLCTSNLSPRMTWKPTSTCLENLTMVGCIDPWAQGLAGPVQWANPWRTAGETRPHPVNDAVLGSCGLFFSVCLFGWGWGAEKSGFQLFWRNFKQICVSGEFVVTPGKGTLPTTAIQPPSCVKSGCHVCTVYFL